jgi:carboxylesterase type B
MGYRFCLRLVADPEARKLGVAHASELSSVVGQAKSETGSKMIGYYSSCEFHNFFYNSTQRQDVRRTESRLIFALSTVITTGNPNRDGFPQWPAYALNAQKQILFGEDSVEVEEDAMRRGELDWWLSVPEIAPH